MTRKWNLPLTYEPKIGPVIRGEIRQTIRTGRKFSVGDLVRFYKWTGKPYRSPRITITEYQKIDICLDIIISPEGIQDNTWEKGFILGWDKCDGCAALDGIVPPTGEALRDVLMSKNKIPEEGIKAQIIRW